MECNETRRLLEADTDAELDLVHHLALASHLRTCADCTRRAEAIRARRTALREGLPRFTAPPELVDRIRATLRGESVPERTAVSAPPRLLFLHWRFWKVTTGLAASFAVALAVGFSWGNARARSQVLFDEAFSDHIRSLQASHLTDVASTDQHTVRPWFAGHLDFSPPVVDLASAGFPLAGGRLEHLDGQPAAALVFHRRQHTINLFIWPALVTKLSIQRMERDGYHAETWSQDSFNFLAVSDIPADELNQFAEALRVHR